MSTDNNIKTFTATDIEKYHKRQLSSKEMHALEKAALDDPFLADALEGYAAIETNVNADIAELKKRLAEKTEQAKVIPIQSGGTTSFRWLRVAVMIVIIAGGGLLAYQFLFKASKDNSIAESKEKEQPKKETNSTYILPTTDSVTISGSTTQSSSTNDKTDSQSETGKRKIVSTIANGNSVASHDTVTKIVGLTKADDFETTPSVTVKTPDQKNTDKVAADLSKPQGDIAGRRNDIIAKNETPALKEVTVRAKSKNDTENFNSFGYTAPYRNANTFRGTVTDANNNALPFANITNTRDNVGTYSDAQGNFTLLSTDSILNVQVRSLGFESNNIELRNRASNNRVLMQEDRSLNAKILDTVKRNLSRARGNTMTVEEPEPEDGWDSYGSYVANNLNVPDNFEMRKAGAIENTVEVSFEVNKNGEPVNLKVEKSLCDKCDKEAKRLIMDGPKWKRKTKKSKRVTISVPFIKPE